MKVNDIAILYCCEDVKSHRSGGDTVPSKNLEQAEQTLVAAC